MAENLQIERKLVDNGAILLQLSGILDAQTFEKLETEIQQLFDRGGYRIIVDLTGVPYVSSAGIGVLMNAMAHTHLHKGDIVLLCLNAEVRDVFDSLSLLEVFKIYEALDQATAHFK